MNTIDIGYKFAEMHINEAKKALSTLYTDAFTYGPQPIKKKTYERYTENLTEAASRPEYASTAQKAEDLYNGIAEKIIWTHEIRLLQAGRINEESIFSTLPKEILSIITTYRYLTKPKLKFDDFQNKFIIQYDKIPKKPKKLLKPSTWF